MIERDRERIREAVRLLLAAERPIRVLRSVSWDASVKEAFFALRARELPEVTYPVFQDGAIVREALAAARQIELPEGPIRDWLDRIAASIGTSAAMLEAVGTPEFFERSRTLYGEPTSELYGEVTPLELATAIESFADDVANIDLGAPAPACIPAHVVADRIRAAVQGRFGSEAPEVEVVQTLASNAIAGSRRIRLRDGTCFSDRDVIQLIEHEAFIHVCTFLNGKAQEDLPILGCAHAGTTKTQEGLAVLSEFMTAAMEPDRFRRLGDRVLAIQMAIEGADFLQVYRFFQTRVEDDQAYENTRRVFRGGVLTGGAPFTKDAVYLDGLLR
ncbi:MAG: tyrosine/phenylalanine carboxypeptidase domain-containing protein, partial [Planctomycetota bacterium]